MAASRSLPLRDLQRGVLCAALRAPGDDARCQVLVQDGFARDVVGAVLRARDLRRLGVALATQIDAPRAEVPDAGAVYVVAPTAENVAWVLRDAQAGRYARVCVAFASAASARLLAALGAQLPVPTCVSRVVDLYAGFVALEQNLFSLGVRGGFAAVKAVDSEQALEQYVRPVVAGLLSVCVTLGLVPIIRAQRGGAAAAVAEALDAAIRENLELFRGAGVSASAFRRPLLLLMDRDFDFNAMLYHTWTYQALVFDSFATEQNSVTVPATRSREELKYDLDKGKDDFWARTARAPFPEVAQSIETALAQYRSDVEQFNQRAGSKDAGSDASTAALAHAVSSLPELSERKHTIDVHTNIATAVLEEVNTRALDTFFELETQILSAAHAPTSSAATSPAEYKVALMELLRGERETATGDKRGAGTADDRLRLFLIFYLAFGAQLSEEEVAAFRGLLTKAGASVDAVYYVQKLRGFRHDLVAAPSRDAAPASKRAMLRGVMSNVVNRGLRGIASAAQSARDVVLQNRRALPTAAMLKLFMSDRARAVHGPAAADVLDGYLLFDPKMEAVGGALAADDAARRKARQMVFSDAIVFMVGGGSYVEFEDCLSAVQACPDAAGANVLYGSTEVLSSAAFLRQVAQAQNKAAA